MGVAVPGFSIARASLLATDLGCSASAGQLGYIREQL
jgi:hypothetical protein